MRLPALAAWLASLAAAACGDPCEHNGVRDLYGRRNSNTTAVDHGASFPPTFEGTATFTPGHVILDTNLGRLVPCEAAAAPTAAGWCHLTVRCPCDGGGCSDINGLLRSRTGDRVLVGEANVWDSDGHVVTGDGGLAPRTASYLWSVGPIGEPGP